ncbi:MAG TPA: ANTAR domain-containing protein [Humibacter sp.]|nr:ANTAR domain-containing protein [Humibacter sp.]
MMNDGPDAANSLLSPFVSSLAIDGASISVVSEGGRQATIAASNADAVRLDELQFDLMEGPRWQAIDEARPVLVAELDSPDAQAWPMFASTALSIGVHAVFSFPLRLGAVVVGAVVVGAIDLYRRAPGALDYGAIETAEALVRGMTPAAARLAMLSADGAEDPSGAPAMRREVHQAVGMIIVQLDVSATDAFARLRAHAFATDRSVRDVAADVVRRNIDFGALSDDPL